MVGPVTVDPGRGQFMVTARAPHPGRGKIPLRVSGAGETEVAALVDLHGRLTGKPRPADDAARRAVLNRKLRQAFYQGAKDQAASEGRQLDECRVAPLPAALSGRPVNFLRRFRPSKRTDPRALHWFMIGGLGHLFLNPARDQPPGPARPVCGTPAAGEQRAMDVNAGDAVCPVCNKYVEEVYFIQIA
jgi:hypothetical protein